MYDSSSRISEIVSRVRREARSAEREFDRRNNEIQRKASYSIDLFGGTATSQVVELASDARRACDELYASYQSLIQILDRECRPLLSSTTPGPAIREVADLIKWLNDESEIENNFTASLNSYSLGQVASAKYVPRTESRMIQKFWESQYNMTPEAKDAERRREEARQRQRQRMEEERLRKEEEKRRQEERRRQEEAERLLRDMQEKEYMEMILADAGKRVNNFLSALGQERQRQIDVLKTGLQDKLAEFRQEKQRLERELSSLGLLKGARKKALRQKILILELRIQKLKGESILSPEIQRIQELETNARTEYERTVETYLNQRFPNRNAPKSKSGDQRRYYENPNFARIPIPEAPDPATVFAP